MLIAASVGAGTAQNPLVDTTLVTTPTAGYSWASQNYYTPAQRAAADFVHPFLNTDGTFKAGTQNAYLSTSYIFTAEQIVQTGRAASSGQPIYNYATNQVSDSIKNNQGYNTNSGYTVTLSADYASKLSNFARIGSPIPDSPNLARINGSLYMFRDSANENLFYGKHEKDTDAYFKHGDIFDLSLVGTFAPDNVTQTTSYLNGSQMYTVDSEGTVTYYAANVQTSNHASQGAEQIFLSERTPTYLRIYEINLTADEIANNHFVDLCRYYHVDTGLFRNADSATQKNIIDAFRTVTINGNGVNKQYIKDTMALTIFGVDKAQLAQALIFAGFQARTNTNIGLRSVFVLNEDVLASLGDKVVGYGAMVGKYIDGDTFDSFTATYNGTRVVYTNAEGAYNGEGGFKLFTNESEKNDILTAKGISEGNYNVFALTTDFIKDATIKEVLEGTASVSGDFNQKLMYRAFIILTDGNGNYYTYYINAASDNYTANNGALSMYEVAKHYENDFGSYDTIRYVLENSGN